MVSVATPVYISVRALTNKFGDDITRGFRGANRAVSRNGEDLGRAFTQGFNKGVDVNAFRRVSNGLQSMVPGAVAAQKAFTSLIRYSYTLSTALTGLVGGFSSVISSIGALAGAAGGAVTTVATLGNAFFALGAGMAAVRLATGGVGGALKKLQQQTARTATTGTQTALAAVRDSQAREAAARRIEDAERALMRVIENNRERMISANEAVADAQRDLNRAILEGREELQQLGFDAEDAAINEQRAAIELERARETLARVQDLPPNSRARREAELAYAEADLNYRKAKDANADLQKEQDRLARTGVNGIQGVIDARNKLAEAEEDRAKTAKDALEDEADAQRNLNEAKKDSQNVDDRQAANGGGAAGAAAAAGAAWDEGLNAAQRKFVLFLNSLKPQFDELNRIAAEAFLPDLQTAIEILMAKAYPVVATGIGTVANAMGVAVVEIANFITTTENLAKLNTLFDSSGRIIETLGGIIGRTYGVILSILTATAPIAERFFTFVEKQLELFDDHLNSVEGNQQLTTFFQRATDTAILFGDIFGNIFRGIGAVIDANMGEGSGGWIILNYIKEATESFGNSDNLKQFFADVATNATHVLDTLGNLAGALADLGANQNIGKAFETLNRPENVKALNDILQLTADAAPKLAELTGIIGRIIAALSDTGALEVFFETLTNILTPILDFVSDPANKEFLDFWGRVFAMFSAVGLILGGVGTGLKIFVGILAGIINPIATLIGWGSKLTPIFSAVGSAFGVLASWARTLGYVFTTVVIPAVRTFGAALMANPIGLIVTAVGALVGALIWFFTETEVGRKMWAEFTRFLGEAWDNTVKWIGEALTNMGQWFSDVWTNISNGINAFVQWVVDIFMNWTIYGLIIQNWDAIVLFFQDTWNNIMGFFDAAFKWIDTYVLQPMSLAFQAVGWAFEQVGNFIGEVWTNIQNAINTVWQWINRYIFAPIKQAINLVQLAFAYAGAMIAKTWDDMMKALDTVWKWIDDNIFDPIKTAVGLVQEAFENVADGIAKAWDGIKKAAAVPINFVIDTVYNNGLRSFWNDIAGNFGMDNLKLPKANKIAFATGGVLPGYSPGKDIHKFYSPTGGWLHLSGGEAIMRPEWTRKVGGPAAVARMNRAARSGQAFATGGVYGARTQRFANGGTTNFGGDFLDGLGDILAAIGDFFVDPISAVKKHLIDGMIKPLMSGAGDNVFTDLIGGVPVKIAENIGTAFKKFFGGGEGTNKPANAMGWRAMQALVEQTIPGARITSAYRPGSITVNGGKSYHGSGRAIDVVPATMDTFNRMLALFPNARELIYSPAGNRQLLNGKPHYWTGAVRATHWDHVHAAMANGGTVYPSAGGTIVQVAEAGRAERIEPLDQNGLSDRDKAMIKLLAGDGRSVVINVTQLPGESGEELAREVSRIISREMRMGSEL